MIPVPRIPKHFQQRPILEVAEDLGIALVEERHPWYECCCPLHAERHPSFRVNADEGFFRCFGCGARGDALELVYLVRSRTDSSYTRYQAYEEVAEEQDWRSLMGEVIAAALEQASHPPPRQGGLGSRALAEYLAATRGRLDRRVADRLVTAGL